MRGAGEPDVSQLCGNCGRGIAAISPDGDVWPCVFSRWVTTGNVLRTPLAEILAGPAMVQAVDLIPGRTSLGDSLGKHIPDLMSCTPDDPGGCTPAADGACEPSKSA